MKRFKSAVLIAFLVFLFSSLQVWAQCPEDLNDLGECDTLHLVALDTDTICESFPCNVEVLILVTHDVNDMDGIEDSISGLVVPLTWTTTNPSAYCSLGEYWNTTSMLYLYPDFERSIFRHIVEGEDTLYHNRMAHLEAAGGLGWSSIIEMSSDTTDTLIEGYHVIRPYFRLQLIPMEPRDQRWWEGNRVLLVTMTFRVEDEMMLCIDSVSWPPGSNLSFTRIDAETYIPRIENPWCLNITYSSVKEIEGATENKPKHFSLTQNYPNPFNPVTNFRFSLPKPTHVEIKIFNIMGQRVKTLVDGDMEAGIYVVDWEGRDEKGNPVSSGIYFYRMQAGEFSDMKKMVLLK